MAPPARAAGTLGAQRVEVPVDVAETEIIPRHHRPLPLRRQYKPDAAAPSEVMNSRRCRLIELHCAPPASAQWQDTLFPKISQGPSPIRIRASTELPSPAPELGFTRVRHSKLAEVRTSDFGWARA